MLVAVACWRRAWEMRLSCVADWAEAWSVVVTVTVPGPPTYRPAVADNALVEIRLSLPYGPDRCIMRLSCCNSLVPYS